MFLICKLYIRNHIVFNFHAIIAPETENFFENNISQPSHTKNEYIVFNMKLE